MVLSAPCAIQRPAKLFALHEIGECVFAFSVELMDFRLCYRGGLPVANDTRNFVNTKHAIRVAFNDQLQNLLRLEPRLYNETLDAQRADVTGGGVLKPHNGRQTSLPLWFEAYGIAFLPIIDRARGFTCYVDIVLLSRTDELARIVYGSGDIDNRLKIILDALRIPHQKTELPASAIPKKPLPRPLGFCVMEDDSQIKRLSIQTGRLLEPCLPDELESDVRVDIQVTIKSEAGHWLGQS